MNDARTVQIKHGHLVIDEDMLREARIRTTARVIVTENSIVILPDKSEERESRKDEDVIEETFGWMKLPEAAAKYVAESKDLEYEI